MRRQPDTLFAQLGWQTVSALDEIFGKGGTLGRETPSEVVLLPRLRAALERLNPALPPEAINAAVEELTRDRSAMLLVINWRQKSAARSQLTLAIQDVLDTGLPPAYTPELYRQKCSAIFEHIYESCPGEGAGIFNTAA